MIIELKKDYFIVKDNNKEIAFRSKDLDNIKDINKVISVFNHQFKILEGFETQEDIDKFFEKKLIRDNE